MGIIDTVCGIYKAMSAEEQKTLLVRLGQQAIDDGIIDAPVSDSSPPRGGGGSKYSKKKGRGKPWGRIVTKVNTSARGMNKLEGEWFNFDDMSDLMAKQKVISDKGTEPIIIGYTAKSGEKVYITGYSPTLGWSNDGGDEWFTENECGVEFIDDDLILHNFYNDSMGMTVYCATYHDNFNDAVMACNTLLDFDLSKVVT